MQEKVELESSEEKAKPAVVAVVLVLGPLAIEVCGAVVSSGGCGASTAQLCVAGVAWAVWRSKTESKELREMEADLIASTEAVEGLEEVGSASRRSWIGRGADFRVDLGHQPSPRYSGEKVAQPDVGVRSRSGLQAPHPRCADPLPGIPG